MAPYAAAVEFEVGRESDAPAECRSTLVILYDPEQRELWGGAFRLVGHMRAQIDRDMAEDPILGEVLWVGLVSDLERQTSGANLLMGTVTKEMSETFGGLQLRGAHLHVEIRCSWTPDFVAGAAALVDHVKAWGEYLLQIASETAGGDFGLEIHD